MSVGGLDAAVDRIVRFARPEAVFLFGSRARGEAGEGSDWDLFVVVPDDVAPGTITPSAFHRLLRGLGMAFDVVACRRAVFEARRGDLNSLSHDVAREGVLLYEREPRR